jgi:hypothetical protein
MATTYFTVFDKNYAARGLAMIESLRQHSASDIRVAVLALDEDALRVSRHIADEVLRVEDVGDAEFVAAKANRSYEEFCWTCAPILSHFMVCRAQLGNLVAYLDADLYFFSDPSILLDEMGDGGTILIHPHRFSADKVAWEKSAGTFNVGFVGFRASEEARACTARWREQVLALCVKDPEKGLCGDQGYLNEWPAIYPGLCVMQNIGGGVAPWNVNSYDVTLGAAGPATDGVPTVFFHFHQLRIIDCEKIRFLGVIPATGYDFRPETWRALYQPYLVQLKRQAFALTKQGIALNSNRVCDRREFRHYVAIHEMMPVLESWSTFLRWHLSEFFYEEIWPLLKKTKARLFRIL